MKTKPILQLLLALVPAALLSMDASAGKPVPLCNTNPEACEYTGPDAPMFEANVCWTGTHAIVATGPCPDSTKLFYLHYGEVVDPVASIVQGYMPLPWACDTPGYCSSDPVPPEAASVPLCCDFGGCQEMTAVGCPPGSDKLMCENGVSNLDGTITCFEGAEVPDP